MKVVDWQKRAERLEAQARSMCVYEYHSAAVDAILRKTERDEPEATATEIPDQLAIKDSLDLAHRRIGALLDLVNVMAQERVEYEKRNKEFESSVELRFQSLAEFVEMVGQWAEKEKQSRGGH